MSVINATPLLAAAGGEYEISRSVRLRSSASAYFNRTPATTTSRTTWTWSAWVKRGALGGTMTLFGSSGANYDEFRIDGDKFRYFINGAVTADLMTSAVYRDPSAWYHIVLAVDTTQATSSNRIKMYVNGVQVTAFSTSTYPAQNTNGSINSNVSHSIGYSITNVALYFDGYLTEVNFIDGQALTPSSFGETDSITGVWKPKKYAGTYGTNGFYLNFSDPSAATAAAIGKDNSGNSNNWTPNNISVTAGVTYDSMIDTPTMYADGGNGRGNYATLNPIQQYVSGGASLISATVSDGNLKATGITSSNRFTGATIIPTSGKYYCEWTIGATQTTNYVGLVTIDSTLNYTLYAANGNITKNTGAAGTVATYTAGDVIGIAWDVDNSAVTFYKNGASQSALTGVTDLARSSVMVFQTTNTDNATANFGQRPFAYTPPTGFKALNTQNLPDSTIKKGNAYFDVKLYTGNGTTQSITGMSLAPDLVWTKARSSAISHGLFDTVRGAGKAIYSNATNAEFDYGTTTAGELYQFTSDGFNLGSSGNFNANGVTNVAWCWKESASAGFDIVTYTGNGSTQNIAHSLGVAPSMMIVKKRTGTIGTATSSWVVYHKNLTNPQQSIVYLNLTNAQQSDPSLWNNTAPTSSLFSVGNTSLQNENTATYVAYLFSEVAGYSKFGSYTGNGSTDGPFVYLGFRPKFVMIKATSTTGNWEMLDSSRDTYNPEGNLLRAQSSAAEVAASPVNDFLSNGFKPRSINGSQNDSGVTYIYAAFAENPFKNSLAR